jgi:nuclear pore complex protein Nup210
MTCQPPDQHTSLADWWSIAKHATTKQLRKGLASITLLIPWMLWKHRNECVFNGGQPNIDTLLRQIKDEADL